MTCRGIGKDLAGKIVEYLKTGKVREIETAKHGVPRGVVELLNVPGVGPKTAKLLNEREGVRSLARLEALARGGKLRGLPGIQARAEENILKGIAVVRGGQERMPLGKALPLAEELATALRRVRAVGRVEVAGSSRRRKETIGDIDLLAISARPERAIAALGRGYEYVAVTDHGASTRVARGLTAGEVRAHVRRIRAAARRHPGIRVLAGAECDIRADGTLDYPDELLAELDLVVAAVHSAFKQPRGEMTRRMCRASTSSRTRPDASTEPARRWTIRTSSRCRRW